MMQTGNGLPIILNAVGIITCECILHPMNFTTEKFGIRLLLWALFIIPIATLFGLLWVQYPRVPKLDDFESIFGFWLRYNGAESWSQQWNELVSQNMEHRILTVHLLTLFQMKFFGTIRLVDFVIVGNLFWFGTALIFFFHRFDTKQILLLIPVAYFMLQPQVQENSWWAMAAASNYPSLFFIGLSLILLERNSTLMFSGAVVSAAAACFSNGGGMVVWPSGLLLLLLMKQYRKIVPWLVFAVGVVFLYFHNYHSPASAGNSGLQHPLEMAQLILRVLGSFSELPQSLSFVTLLPGVGMLVLLVFLIVQGLPSRNPALFAMFGALLMILGMIALSRFSASGLAVVPSRYKTFSLLFLILLILGMYELYPLNRRWFLSLTGFSAMFWIVCSLIYYPKVFYQNRTAHLSAFNYLQTGTGMDYAPGDTLLSEFIGKGQFVFSDRYNSIYARRYADLSRMSRSSDTLQNRLFLFPDTVSHYTTVCGNFSAGRMRNSGVQVRYLHFVNEQHPRLLEVNDARIRGFKDLIGKGSPPMDTFSMVIPSHMLPAGEYRLRYLTTYKDWVSATVEGANKLSVSQE